MFISLLIQKDLLRYYVFNEKIDDKQISYFQNYYIFWSFPSMTLLPIQLLVIYYPFLNKNFMYQLVSSASMFAAVILIIQAKEWQVILKGDNTISNFELLML